VEAVMRRGSKVKNPEFVSHTAAPLQALANAIAVKTPIDAKVVDLFHEAAVRCESQRH
jgi:hypothetical protein